MGEPPLAGRPDGAGQLAQPSGPPPAAGRERTPPRLPAPALRGERSDAPLGVRALRRPLAPQLLIPPTLGMPLLHLRARGAPHDSGSAPPALAGPAACRPMVPGRALRRRGPREIARAAPGGSRPHHRSLSAADRCRGTPRRQRVPQAREATRDMGPLAATRSHERATLPRKHQPPVEPWRGKRHARPESDTPGWMRGRRRLGGVPPGGDPGLPRRGRRRLLGEGHPLPDGRLARASAQRLQGPVHARGPHQRRVVHQREDVQHRLARPPHGERRVRAGQRRCQAEPPGTWRPQSVATRRGRTPTS